MNVLILTILSIFFNSQDIDSIFKDSNKQYTEGEYQLAVNGYMNIIDLGFESAEVYFNLGNSFYKLNNIPESNYYYEKAIKLLPNDEDIITNLSYAQNLRIDKIEKLPITQIQNIKNSLLNIFTQKNWAILFIILLWCLCILFILYLISKKSNYKRVFFSSSIIILVLSSVSLYLNFEKKELNDIKFGIVFDKEVQVWAEPNEISELKFLIHEGTKVKKIDAIEDWLGIQLENGTLGWIKSASVKLLD